MDAVTAFAARRPEPIADDTISAAQERPRELSVIAMYVLTEEGRKASLLSGGNGRAKQKINLQMAANRLHLVTVDANGVAHLKLRPRYELGEDQRVVRIDSPPAYDVPPSIEELLREAARNHQLEHGFRNQGGANESRRNRDNERRAELAKAFLSDPTRRALANPPPTADCCYLASDHGPVVFRSKDEHIPARQVPEEAHRRFRNDLRTREERNREQRAADLAANEERKRLIAEWIAAHGTPEQQARQAAGMLPMKEAIEAMADKAFAALADRPRYMHDGVGRLQAYLRQFPEFAGHTVHSSQLLTLNADATSATAAQFSAVEEIRSLIPGATATLRVHRFALKGKTAIPTLSVWAILVTKRCGPFKLRREYEA